MLGGSWCPSHPSPTERKAPTPLGCPSSEEAYGVELAGESQLRQLLVRRARVGATDLDQGVGVATVEEEEARGVSGRPRVVLEEHLEHAREREALRLRRPREV